MPSPNVVIICCDDLGYGDLGCYGAEYETPHIDALAAQGVRFTDWHANAPVCSPSRASLLTGKYPQRAGVPGNAPQGRGSQSPDVGLPPEQTTLADRLAEAGYRTGAFGKWHLGMTERDDPLAHGFENFFGFKSGCVDYYSHLMMWLQGHDVPPYHDLWKDRREVWRNGEYMTDLITDRAVEFVRENAAEEPFFAYVAYSAPHYPMHGPSEYWERFEDLEGERRTQAAMIAAVDDGVGALLETLEAEGVAEDTLVVFTSDHGPSREVRNHLDGTLEAYTGGSTGGHRGEKFSLFEGGIRIPAIVRYPDAVDAGGVCDQLAVSMDVLPTVLDFCDLPVPDAVDGESLRRVLSDGADSPHETVYWQYEDQLAVRDGDWKLLIEPTESGSTDGADPPEGVFLANVGDGDERRNRRGDHPEVAERLESRLREWATAHES